MEPITVNRMTDLAIKLAGTYINVDGAHGNQCWDSVARVAQLLGLPVVHTHGEGRWPGWAGNMWDAFPQSAAIGAAYYRVGPDQAGQPGDTAIWGATPGIYPSTHVANVVRDFGGQLLCLSQNSSTARPDLPGYSTDSTGPVILQHLTKKGLLGYLRPRVTGINPQGTTTTEEDDMSADEVWSHKVERTDGADSTAIVELAKIGPAVDGLQAFAKGMNEKLDALILAQANGSEFEQRVNVKIDEVVGNGQKTFWNSEEVKIRLQNTDPTAFAAAVPEAQAKAFLDALGARLGGK